MPHWFYEVQNIRSADSLFKDLSVAIIYILGPCGYKEVVVVEEPRV